MVDRLREMKIFSGSAHPEFAQRVSENLRVPLSSAKVGRFSDGEVSVSIEESVRGADVYVIQPTCPPVNENLMELLILIDALKRASAYQINVVMPYFGYARQDRKTRSREPITAKLVANLLEKAGANRVISADLHAGQIQGFFDIPVDHLMAIPLMASYCHKTLKEELKEGKVAVAAPDIGGVVRARRFALQINADLAIVDKRRSYEVANYCEVLEIIGDVRGKTVVMIDDMIDTAGTVSKASEALIKRGAEKVYVCATHGILSGPAIENLSKLDENGRPFIDQVVLTDTIPLSKEKRLDKIIQLSIASLFAEAINRVHSDHSVSILFR
ncbi:MAG TPA: ribose-phosphate pyrophosphokinase [Synergistaceae bacterium]|nr:ribose-phosphate pyrophosphokinase [Synergistaceae bacterium]